MAQKSNVYKGNGLNEQANNDDIHGFGKLGAAPLALGANRNAPMWKGSSNAPTMLDTFGLSGISGPQPMAMSKQQQTTVHQQAIVMPNQSGQFMELNQAPLSFGNKSKGPSIMVLPS